MPMLIIAFKLIEYLLLTWSIIDTAHFIAIPEPNKAFIRKISRCPKVIDQLLRNYGRRHSVRTCQAFPMPVNLICISLIGGPISAKVFHLEHKKQKNWHNEKTCVPTNEDRYHLDHVFVTLDVF
jgi:hypothetical protein